MAESKLGKDATTLPAGTEAERPANAVTGMIRWNTDTGALEGYDGVEWAPISNVPISATGGTVSDVNVGGVDYRIHAFTSTGTSSFNISNPGTNGLVDVLVVAGGGGAGSDSAAGAGAGGLVFFSQGIDQPQIFNITVGDGGDRGTGNGNDDRAESGDDSSVDITNRPTITALGGGYGEAWNTGGDDGGSGGGGHIRPFAPGSGLQPGTNNNITNDSGNDGGPVPINQDKLLGSGGGGAGEAGKQGNGNTSAGDGGDGLDFSSVFGTGFGENGFFAGGGGGSGIDGQNPPGNGGLGGGGDGGAGGESGQSNTGGGGGGGAENDFPGGFGGSGIVLIRYKT